MSTETKQPTDVTVDINQVADLMVRINAILVHYEKTANVPDAAIAFGVAVGITWQSIINEMEPPLREELTRLVGEVMQLMNAVENNASPAAKA